MSLVERLFPASELAAMRHAVLTVDDQPAAKRRKIDRESSVRSQYSTDSGYNSDDSNRSSKPTIASLAPRKSISSVSQAPASPATSHSDEEDFCEKIAQARARLYSNASLSIPSPPASSREADSPPKSADIFSEEYHHSPVSVKSLADTPVNSGLNLGTLISLGLAATSHERDLLTALAPETRVMPSYNAELRARKLQWLQKRRMAMMREQLKQSQSQSQNQRRTSYAGFAISSHDDEPEEGEEDVKEQVGSGIEQCETPEDIPEASIEQIDDFFNIEAASEQEASS